MARDDDSSSLPGAGGKDKGMPLDDLESQLPEIRQRAITWGPEERHDAIGRPVLRRRRLSNQGSVSSNASRSYQRSVSGVPIEFHRISIQISESEAIREALGRDFKQTTAHKPKAADNAEEFQNVDFHCLDQAAVCLNLGVATDDGLSAEEAASRLRRDGPNSIPHRRPNYIKKVLLYIFGGFCSVLWVGAIIFFICWRPLGDPNPAPYNLGLGILLLIVIFLQASFSAFQDWSTARTMKAILDLLPADAIVLRNGQTLKVPSTDLVVGDVVKVSVGNKVPADIRLLSISDDLRFDRSMLTGESEEVDGAIHMTDNNFLESRNVALMGTMVTNGNATGVVVLTGKDTVMGHIAVSTTTIDDKPTLIQREITRFVIIIICMTICLALIILFTWVGWLRVDHFGYMNVIDMLDDVMGCVVAFIPEGMPVAVTLTLLMIARRMKASNVLPKALSTVETLGCVNVICSDKTGTLTENRMAVVSVVFVDKRLDVDEAISAMADDTAPKALSRLRQASALCNDAMFDPVTNHEPIERRNVLGNATDGAALKFAEAARPQSTETADENFPRIFTVPFNSKNKWMLTLHGMSPEEAVQDEACQEETSTSQEETSTSQEGASKAETTAEGNAATYLLLVKGAGDILLPHCSRYWSCESGEIHTLDEPARDRILQLQESMSRRAERVILLCERSLTLTETPGTNTFNDVVQKTGVEDLTLIGMLGILDPPRKESASTVASCRRAGARFFMVTGDLGLTGAAIAQNIGIFTGEAEPDTFDTIVRRRTQHLDRDVAGAEDANLGHRKLLLEGPSIAQLHDSDWDVVCSYDEIVFGRTMPEQKLRIVNELMARDNVVAVTGDGVNDAPAMRAADVGVAVVSGSDVALEAADLVLMDQFDSIVDAIRLGRLVFQNLQKVISYLLPAGSWSEIWPDLLNVFLGVPLPLSSFLMIIICVFTDLFNSMALIMEQQEFDLLDLPPRNHKTDHLITLKIYIQSYLFIGVMETICAHAMFFYYYWKYARIPVGSLFLAFGKYSDGFYGYTEAELTKFNVTGQCVYFVCLVILQWGNILSVRNKRLSILQADPVRKQRRNPYLIGGMLMSLVIAIFVTEEPGIQRIFGTSSVPLEFWFLPIPFAVGILCMDEIRKLAVRLWPRGWIAKIAW